MNYYDILEVSRTASDEVIKTAYKTLSKKYHPDVYEGPEFEANEKMSQLNVAFEVLSDKQKRKEYDESIRISDHIPPRTHENKKYSSDKEYSQDAHNQKVKKIILAVVVCLFAVPFGVYLINSEADKMNTTDFDGSATHNGTVDSFLGDYTAAEETREPLYMKNGEIVVFPSHFDYPEVTVNAPSQDCYVYFDNVNDTLDDFAFYIWADTSVTMNFPVGTYQLYYATGNDWYGMEEKFGAGTSYYSSSELITLTESDTSYDTLELTLYGVSNGNMDTDTISGIDFPG